MEKDQNNPERKNRKMMGGNLEKPTLIAKHSVEPGQTLSDIALKYYDHATPPYWKFLLEHNKTTLNGSEKNLRAGMDLEIPELPESLK